MHVSGVISLHFLNQKTFSMLLKVSPLTRVNGPTGMDFWTMSNCSFCRKSSFLLKSWTFKGTNSASRQILNTSNLLGSCKQKSQDLIQCHKKYLKQTKKYIFGSTCITIPVLTCISVKHDFGKVPRTNNFDLLEM